MRGKAMPFLSVCTLTRITPAYAGKRRVAPFGAVESGGSPPPMRGKETKKHIEFHVDRITPAYAGKRSMNLLSAAKSWDHPRLCGEKFSGVDKNLPV